MPNYQMGGAFDPTRDVDLQATLKSLTGGDVPWTAVDGVLATGATGSTATALPLTTPFVVTVTGVSGAGVRLEPGTARPGAAFILKNLTTGAITIYAPSMTINTISGATGVVLTATGNKTIIGFCALAGTWQIGMNT